MSKTITAPLRAACERCRAQKLRCVPSSEIDSGVACKRCVSVKVPELCVFVARSQTGRTGRSGKFSSNVEGQPWISSKAKEISMPALPGMSTFALSGSPSNSTEVEPPGPLSLLSTEHTPPALSPDDSKVADDYAPEGSMPGVWQHDAMASDWFSLDSFLQQPSNLLSRPNGSAFTDDTSACGLGDDTAASSETSHSIEYGAHAELQGLQLSPSNYSQANIGNKMDTMDEERPGPLVDLTALLSKMSRYKNRLLKISGLELHDYPVGDALFLSHRFYTILPDYSQIASKDFTSSLSTPTMLLVLSCFMTLTRIYSPIFRHIHEQLSQRLEAHSAHQTRSCAYPPNGVDIHSYRGLRLSQLQPICICTGWDPIRKAVSMLLKSIGGAEEWLGLPPEVRVMALSDTRSQKEQTSRFTGNGGEKTTIFEEGSRAALTNGHLYKTIKKQAKELRGKIEEVEELLQGVTDFSHAVRTSVG